MSDGGYGTLLDLWVNEGFDVSWSEEPPDSWPSWEDFWDD